ncbi:MAG: diphthamide biosynthesis enzyme Dph2 [Candidatus Aenigmarchaeota archaeon]|nr:diphthamide biosynthesis enzyme Dph2 [Candidatus Aenigmarchaeota archaeon]MDW8160332.1 diphthamide biosynthesis enzyme Dph2 [Candidatus Aenigmarchaeota archaeon]
MELEKVIEDLKNRGIERVFVQLPEGLMTHFKEISELLERNGITPVISIERTYGVCDIRDEEAKRVKCGAIIHFGHNDFGFELKDMKLPVYFVEWFLDRDVRDLATKVKEEMRNFKKIGIVYSLQYKKLAENLKKELEDEKEVLIGGQILGCNVSNLLLLEKEIDAILVISAGKFYHIYPSIKSKKPVFLLDVEKTDFLDLEKEVEKIKKIKEWNKNVLKNAKEVGILLSWKKGQVREFKQIYDSLRKMGKKVYVLAFDDLEENFLEGIKVDVLINLACPRIGVDDLNKFKIPILNLEEIF